MPPGWWSAGEPVAIQLARPLNGIDHVLSRLRLILFVLCAGGVALAAVLGRLAASRVLAPLAEVAQTAEHISKTEDLASRIHVHADDEVGQLATRFNAMMERLQSSREELDDSVRAQRQLVADASHELRTPITSLRTNIEVLLAGGRLSDEDRRRLLADVVEQSEELSALIGDLIELARGDLPHDMVEDIRLDRILEDSISRARRDHPEVAFEASLQPVTVEGVPERLGQARRRPGHRVRQHPPDRRGPARRPRPRRRDRRGRGDQRRLPQKLRRGPGDRGGALRGVGGVRPPPRRPRRQLIGTPPIVG